MGLPHDLRRPRLRPLLPERARRRPALDGGRRRSRVRVGASLMGSDGDGPARASGDARRTAALTGIEVASAPCSYGAFELTVGVLPNVPGPDEVVSAMA